MVLLSFFLVHSVTSIVRKHVFLLVVIVSCVSLTFVLALPHLREVVIEDFESN